MRQDDVNEEEWRKRKNWRGGPLGIYSSKQDDRAFVPKRHPSLGVTPNLSTGTGIGFMIGVIIFIVVLVWASESSKRQPAPPPATSVPVAR